MKTNHAPIGGASFHLNHTTTPALALTGIALVNINIPHISFEAKMASIGIVALMCLGYFLLIWPKKHAAFIKKRDTTLEESGVLPFLMTLRKQAPGRDQKRHFIAENQEPGALYNNFCRAMLKGLYEGRTTEYDIAGTPHTGSVKNGQLVVVAMTRAAADLFQQLPKRVRKHILLLNGFGD